MSFVIRGWTRGIGERHPNPYRAKEGQSLIDDGPVQGLPIGGLGSGSIGRDHDGRFSRWHLEPGGYRYQPSPGSWLAAEIVGEARPVALMAPGCDTRPSGLAPEAGPVGEYEALYPFAWYRYRPALNRGVGIDVRQWSPVIPGREDESSWPVGYFEVTAVSERDSACEVVLALVFELPLADRALAGGSSPQLSARDTIAEARFASVPASFALAVEGGQDVAAAARPIDEAGYEALAGGLWPAISQRGAATAVRPGLAAAVRFRLEPGESKAVTFALAWDLPLIRFGEGRQHAWYRAHTRRFGRQGDSAAEIAQTALARRGELAAEVSDWQRDLAGRLERWGAPEWMLAALCNELYMMVEGGTAWVVGAVDQPQPEEHFAVLECLDYPFYETLDVRYYSSFSLLELWPRLERVVIDDFVRSLPVEDGERVLSEWDGQEIIRKRRDAAPHDLGGPTRDPFRHFNAYEMHDTGEWRDLNAKLVLQVARDAHLWRDDAFATAAWPACRSAIRYLEAMDTNGDGLLDHEGRPEQTYDTWPMKGASAYSGDLWLACLAAGTLLAQKAGDQPEAERLEALRARAQAALEATLWTGSYYRFDSGSGAPASDVVMADQLAGTWYTLLLGLPPPHPEGRAEQALETVLSSNLRGFAGGRLGPVNGRSPDGGPAPVPSEQAHEVWTGTAWSLASMALLMGRDQEAWRVGEAIYRTLYEESGLWFRTPEAWTEDRRFRASMYHRPLAVWSAYTVLRLRFGE